MPLYLLEAICLKSSRQGTHIETWRYGSVVFPMRRSISVVVRMDIISCSKAAQVVRIRIRLMWWRCTGPPYSLHCVGNGSQPKKQWSRCPLKVAQHSLVGSLGLLYNYLEPFRHGIKPYISHGCETEHGKLWRGWCFVTWFLSSNEKIYSKQPLAHLLDGLFSPYINFRLMLNLGGFTTLWAFHRLTTQSAH